MIAVSFVFSFLSGDINVASGALMTGAQDAVEMSLGLLGMMCFWSGLLKIAEKSGLTQKIAGFIKPATKFLFPDIPSDSPAIGAIVMNMTANLMGLSNAATPLGLKAMHELSRENGKSRRASNAMCMFVLINTAAITLFPSTLISLRSAAGSANPFEILMPVWICSFAALFSGVTAAKIMEKTEKKL